METHHEPPSLPNEWLGFAIRQINNNPEFIMFGEWCGERVRSQKALYQLALSKHKISDFGWICVSCNDYDGEPELSKTYAHKPNHVFYKRDSNNRLYPLISPVSQFNNYDFTAPDFVFYNWPETGVENYETSRIEFLSIKNPPATNLAGWRGTPHTPMRSNLISLSGLHTDILDCCAVNHMVGDAVMSYQQQIAKCRFLLDLEGFGSGYSGRLKLFFSMPRVTFIQDRRFKEDYFQWLVPWKHYVPFNNDLSDLIENLNIIKANPNQERDIIAAANEFSNTYLTQDQALERLYNRILSYIL